MQTNELPKATARFPQTHQPLLTDLTRILQALRKNTRDPSAFPTTNDPLVYACDFIVLPTLAVINGIYTEIQAAGLRLEGLGLTPTTP